MPGELGPRALYDYTSDDTHTYAVMMRTALATAGGFAASESAVATFPRTWRMRYVLGKAADGTKKKLHCVTADNTLFVAGGTFTVGANEFTVTGRLGEKRKA